MKKKLLSMIVLMSMVFSMFVFNAGAQTTAPKSLLVFGDSISTGYGLADKSKSFGSLLAQKLGISGSYVNLAADGATSSDILSTVQNHTKEIAAADTVLLTVGGNDLLSVLYSNIKTALGLSNDATYEQIQMALLTNSNAAALIAAQLQKTEVQAQFASAETGLSKNLSSIVSAIKAANPVAKLYIQTIYNPLDGVPGYEPLSSIADTVLCAINTAIKNGASGNYTVIDTYTAFKGKSLLLTNIVKLDIHPNEAGHEAIYELAYAAASGQEQNIPVVTGVDNNGVYNADKTITFNKGTATLDDEEFTSGDTVGTEGEHTLVVTDAAGNITTVVFTIDKSSPIVTARTSKKTTVKNGAISSSNVTISIKDLFTVTKTVTLNGKTCTWPSGSTFTKDGKYVVTVKDQYGHVTKAAFTVDKTAPKITAKHTKYGLTVVIVEANLSAKTATFIGKKIAWPSGNKFTKKGAYVITAADKAGNKSTLKVKI